jgi:hypothetical protein
MCERLARSWPVQGGVDDRPRNFLRDGRVMKFQREIGLADAKQGSVRLLAGLLEQQIRPALVEFGEKVRQAERPVGREIENGSDFFRFVMALGGHWS